MHAQWSIRVEIPRQTLATPTHCLPRFESGGEWRSLEQGWLFAEACIFQQLHQNATLLASYCMRSILDMTQMLRIRCTMQVPGGASAPLVAVYITDRSWRRPLLLWNMMWLAAELVPGPLWFTSRKNNVRVIMELKGLCLGLYYPLSWSNGSAVREAKEVLLLQMSRGQGKEIPFSHTHTHTHNFIKSYSCLRGEKGRRRGEGQTWRKFPKLPFLYIY